MKNYKTLIVLGAAVLLVTGCSKKMECTYENKDGLNYTSTVTISYKDNEVKTATNVMKYETEEVQDTMCQIFKMADEKEVKVACKGKEVKIKNYNKSIEKEHDISTKDKLVEYLEENNYVCKK